MQVSGLRGIISGIIQIVLCFIVGVYAAESAISSAAIIALIMGALLLILAGKRCWWLIFLLGPVVDILPLPGGFGSIPGAMCVAFVVLAYWLLLWGMGYVKIKWRSFLLLDFLVLALLAYVVATYIRRPVSINILGLDTDVIGGADYVYYLCAFAFYLTLSCIPLDKEEFTKVLRWSVVVIMGCLVIQAGLDVATGNIVLHEESMKDSQIGGFGKLGQLGLVAVCAKFPLSAIMLNPILLACALLSCAMVFISGGREFFMVVFFTISNIVIIKREILAYLLMGSMAIFSIYALSFTDMMDRVPFSVQRIMWMLPGVKINERAESSAGGTWEWRLQLWDLALDKRTGYINDYVFGDGYGQSKSATQRRAIARMRGEYVYGQDLDEFAVNGVWHNGVITNIHRLGYVGLSLVLLILIVGSVYMFRVCFALRGSPLFFPIVFYVAGYAAVIPELCLGAHGARQFIFQFSSLALIKLVYCEARKTGLIKPWYRRVRYVPQMIQEHERRGGLDCGCDVMSMK